MNLEVGMGSWPGHGDPPLVSDASGSVAHLVSRRHAWGVALMVVALAVTDYLDRQIVVSTFPYLKKVWGLSDTALGALVTTVSVTMAVFALPAARLADRWGRVKTIAAMGSAWSLAALACAVSGNYAQLFAARSLLGVGEAGYGPAGAALLSGYFPQRLRATVLSVFQAAGPLGSVLGVVLGGVMAARLGWRVTLGAFGVPGLLLALVFLKVRDYRTPVVSGVGGPDSCAGPRAGQGPTGERAPFGRQDLAAMVRELFRSRTAVWCYLGGAFNLVVLSTLYTWLPSYLGRAYGLPSVQAGMAAALFILAGFVGAIVFGHLADRCAAGRPRRRLMVPAVLAAVAWVLLSAAFGVLGPGDAQYALIVVAGLPVAAALGTAPAAVIDVVHPGVRATAVGMTVLVQNLFGLAVGPVLTGLLSDAFGLGTALAVMPLFCLAAAAAFRLGSRSYEKDLAAVSGGGPVAMPPGTHERELSS
ncbi:MFS transporter [Streptomyces kronopolitis]|uniref:MFS transporter n=1 Tax=Streptomyces kronopolitis TaxID=1612435 RepID=UPI0020BE86A8|nr:MFS transporter [Streptomyces kronopolitis]MCL6300797.1 MFS transporter [Streptomyces kronopolitis]